MNLDDLVLTQSILLTWDISFNQQNFDSKMYCKKEDYKNLNENSESV